MSPARARTTALVDASTILVALFGALATAAVAVLGGAQPALGALCGALVALVDWVALRALGRMLLEGGAPRRLAIGGLILKVLTLLLVVWVLLAVLRVHPVGFVVGTSGLVLGSLIGSLPALAGTARED
ncbi:MAG: hypothetical protein NZ898_11860 [Myxococcota bacterium]|nr:hypothetical protein [Myxococcota bacterium]MDW8363381.1 hypothetical protein [Myxococcales bacterium]